MSLTNCSQCKYFVRQPHHSTDIVCSLDPAYASMWQRLNSLDEYTLNCIPVDGCREFELDPSLELKTIPLSLPWGSWQTLARESNNLVVRDTLSDLLVHLELFLTVKEWQAIANANTDPNIRVALGNEGIEPKRDRWIEVDSSAFSAIAYGDDSTLKIRFNQGAIYQYYNVPHQLYLELLDAESKGSFFNQYIKHIFHYSHV